MIKCAFEPFFKNKKKLMLVQCIAILSMKELSDSNEITHIAPHVVPLLAIKRLH